LVGVQSDSAGAGRVVEAESAGVSLAMLVKPAEAIGAGNFFRFGSERQ
jgi:hypothetical protein